MSERRVRVLFHDYGGHAFTAWLARALSGRDFDISYVSFAGFPTPKGRVGAEVGDPDNFRIAQLDISRPFDKDNLGRRLLQQREYAKVLRAFVLRSEPDVVISSNAPLEVQEMLLATCRKRGAGFVFWCQDIHSEAIARILGKKHRLLGELAGRHYRAKEQWLFRQSDAVIVIAEGFRRVLQSPPWNLARADIQIIENIAPLDEIPLLSRDNEWSRLKMRPGRRRIVYTGTLARKHNPDVLLALARSLEADIWLFSEGSGADYVAARAKVEGLGNMFVRPWPGVDDFPKALAGGDLLYAAIEEDAGLFSVPSKVLSYLAAGRPIIASLPLENLAGATILRAGAGLVSRPNDLEGLVANARILLDDTALRERMGANGRRYAEAAFDIDRFADRFARILRNAAVMPRQGSVGSPTMRADLESAMR